MQIAELSCSRPIIIYHFGLDKNFMELPPDGTPTLYKIFWLPPKLARSEQNAPKDILIYRGFTEDFPTRIQDYVKGLEGVRLKGKRKINEFLFELFNTFENYCFYISWEVNPYADELEKTLIRKNSPENSYLLNVQFRKNGKKIAIENFQRILEFGYSHL